MRVTILGPLGMECGGRRLTPTAPKLRQVLALLLMNANPMVPVSTLVEELWQERPPASARTTLQTYVLQLRRLLGTAVEDTTQGRTRNDLLTTEPGGYRLQIEEGQLDLHDYDAIVAEGSKALEVDDYQHAAAALGRARRMWRGPALVDVQAGSNLQPLVLALNESRMTTVEHHVEVMLRVGRHLDLISDLTTLTAEHPYHERLHGYLMLALHRCGRRHDALQVYQALRALMIKELGFEPSGPLGKLHNDILADAPGLSDLATFIKM